jgi:hypothetical protein
MVLQYVNSGTDNCVAVRFAYHLQGNEGRFFFSFFLDEMILLLNGVTQESLVDQSCLPQYLTCIVVYCENVNIFITCRTLQLGLSTVPYTATAVQCSEGDGYDQKTAVHLYTGHIVSIYIVLYI